MQDLSISYIRMQFLENPKNLEEWKIKILKDYYYNWATKILELNNIEDFRIGSNSNKNLLFFNSIKNKTEHLILKIDVNEYFIYHKNFDNNIISSTKNIYNTNKKLLEKNNEVNYKNCFKTCQLL